MTTKVQGLSPADKILNCQDHLMAYSISKLGFKKGKALRIRCILIALGHVDLINLESIGSIAFEKLLRHCVTSGTRHLAGPLDFARHCGDEKRRLRGGLDPNLSASGEIDDLLSHLAECGVLATSNDDGSAGPFINRMFARDLLETFLPTR